MQTKNIVAFASGFVLVVGALLTYKFKKSKKSIEQTDEDSIIPNPYVIKGRNTPNESATGEGSIQEPRYPRNMVSSSEAQEGDISESAASN